MRSGDANWPRDALPKGTDLHGYRLDGIIGRGGFGITYRAVDGIDQIFAIKECFPRQFAVRQGTEVLPADVGDAEPLSDCLVRFTKEARALRQLSTIGDAGDGVVRVATFFQTNRTAYLVMEYLSGRSLDDLIRDDPNGVDEATLHRILPPLLRAVGCVHDAGLLHRDIKPANIMLREDGRPVLIDFGAARGTTQGQTVTYTQIFSEGYAPIEQFAGAQQGPFSDIYALGATLYRAIGGKTVDSFTRHQALLKGQPDPRIPATEIGAGRYGSGLLTMIDAAMIVAPEQRPQSVQALLRLLNDNSGSDDATVRWPEPSGRAAGVPGPLRRESDSDAEPTEALGVGRRRAGSSGASGTTARPRAPVGGGHPPLRRKGWIIALAVLGLFVVGGGWAGVAWLRAETEQVPAARDAEGRVAEAQAAARAAQAAVAEEAAAAAKAAEDKAAGDAAARKASEENAAAAAALEKAAADQRAEAASKAAAAEAAAAEAAAKRVAEERVAEAARRAAAAEAAARAVAVEAAAKKTAEEKATADKARSAEAARVAAEAEAAKAAARTAARKVAEAVPAPHAQQSLAAQATPARNAYFAIARAPEKNYLAYTSMNQATQEIADEAALQKCVSANGSGCGVYVRGYDQCVAFAFGGSFFGTVHSVWKQDADLAVARSSALKACSDVHFGQCEIIASFCSRGQ
jgi:serine/threonine protein kinase